MNGVARSAPCNMGRFCLLTDTEFGGSEWNGYAEALHDVPALPVRIRVR